jgi:hypothetical protein
VDRADPVVVTVADAKGAGGPHDEMSLGVGGIYVEAPGGKPGAFWAAQREVVFQGAWGATPRGDYGSFPFAAAKPRKNVLSGIVILPTHRLMNCAASMPLKKARIS